MTKELAYVREIEELQNERDKLLALVTDLFCVMNPPHPMRKRVIIEAAKVINGHASPVNIVGRHIAP